MPNPRVQIFSTIFYSSTFTALGFTVRFLIHFELFVEGTSHVSS